MKTDDLLAVLDMTEDEQEKALWQIYSPDYYCCLADLAFRLRDEASKISEAKWGLAKHAVANKWVDEYIQLIKDVEDKDLSKDKICLVNAYFVNIAKPIHFIIAALIAKGEK